MIVRLRGSGRHRSRLKLTVTTKKRLVSTEPVDGTTLRDKYAIMWLLAQMKQPGRSIYRDFDRSTFSDFLERLLDKKNFNLHIEVNGTLLLVTEWTDCMSHEVELRKDANRLCREEGSGIKAALWTTIENTEHGMIHWLQLVSIANSRPGGGDCAALERKVNDLQREVRRRSRTPRRKGGNRKPPSPSRPVPAAGSGMANAPQQKNLLRGKD